MAAGRTAVNRLPEAFRSLRYRDFRVVIAGLGVAPAFAFSGAGHLLVLATLAAVGAEGRPRRARPTTLRQDIAEGVAYALRTPEIRAVLGVLFVISFCAFNFSIWVPLLARNVLGQGAQEFGFLLSAVGLGGVVAERSSVSAAFVVWGAGGLAVLALLMADRRRPRTAPRDREREG